MNVLSGVFLVALLLAVVNAKRSPHGTFRAGKIHDTDLLISTSGDEKALVLYWRLGGHPRLQMP